MAVAPIFPTVRTEVFGDKHLIGTMTAWAARASNPIPAFEAMHEYVLDVEQELFDTEGASGANGPWDKRIDDRKDPGHPLLQASGRLMRSLTQKGSEHVWMVTPRGFAFGTNVDYAQALQTGTEFMEPRPVIDLTLANRQALVEILHLFITRAGLTPTGGGFFTRVRGGKGRFIG